MDRRWIPRSGTLAVAGAVLLSVSACTGNAATPSAASPEAAAPASSRPSPTTALTTPSTAPQATPTTAPERDPAAYVEGAPYAVTIDPADFVAVVDNPYFPMIPGTTTIFDGGGEHIVVEVTDYTKIIEGVAATVVRDRVYTKGKLAEDTFDWYAQDQAGNVWYFGEDTIEYENGKPGSTAGSWQAGVDGAQPGIVMLADPQVGDVYRNEFYPGQAEDLSKVIELGGQLTVPAGAYSETILTEDWTPLEPDQLERKTYAPGVGQIAEGSVDKPTINRLIEVQRP